MRKTSIPNKLNHKLQAHARVCEENRELEKPNLVEIFCGERIDFERLWKKNSDTNISDETQYKVSS